MSVEFALKALRTEYQNLVSAIHNIKETLKNPPKEAPPFPDILEQLEHSLIMLEYKRKEYLDDFPSYFESSGPISAKKIVENVLESSSIEFEVAQQFLTVASSRKATLDKIVAHINNKMF
jgi:hypothetical protein